MILKHIKNLASRFLMGKAKRKRAFSVLVLPAYFLLALVWVTMGVPAIAHGPTPLNLPQQEEVSSSPTPDGAEFVETAQTPSGLLQQGKQRYQVGQFFDAASLWEQAAQAYGASGAIAQHAQALNYLSLAYQHLGQWQQAQEAVETSLNYLQGVETLEASGEAVLAQALNARGQLQLAQGDTEAALESWRQAEAAYDRADDDTGKLGSQLNQAQALQALGQYRKAQTLLERVNGQLQAQPDTLLKASSLRSLGVALQTIGNPLRSKAILEQSWAISEQLNSPADTSATLLSIGNIARDFRQDDVALGYYQEAANLAVDPLTQVQAQLNQLSLSIDLCQVSNEGCSAEAIQALLGEIQPRLMALPPSRASVYARVNLTETLLRIPNPSQISSVRSAAELLATAVEDARQLRDRRSEAYAITELGKLYAQTQKWDDARGLTEKALQIAQVMEADDIAARASGQLGHILKQQGDTTGAIAAYRTAFETLQTLRGDLVAINPDTQFEFKESVEPIYRELVSLLLQPQATQGDLKQAREVLEALQLAELDNFFGDACLKTDPVALDDIDPQAAVIYPIILSDRLEVILSLSDGTLYHYATPLTASEVEQTLQQLYSSLYPVYPSEERLQLSEEVYNWLVRPAEAELEGHRIKTLVFVPDGFFRNLPMAALYDGDRYLLEKYSLALSPGLQLFPQGLKREDLSVLAVGLTEARQGFNPLPSVEGEVQQITTDFNSKVLLNQAFTLTEFEAAIEANPFPIVHLATHGQFSSNPAETFLLTWDDRIGVKDLDLLFQNSQLGISEPIELLVMSACQTAAGDNRATLGLAGFALRSGARSTLASLWSVSDRATADLMSQFYSQIAQGTQNMTKAEALRQAQLALLDDPLHKHPYFWASFVLVGNWL